MTESIFNADIDINPTQFATKIMVVGFDQICFAYHLTRNDISSHSGLNKNGITHV